MLDYFSLILIIFVGVALFYGIIAIHDIPYELAKKREHPQQDAIHVAGWISLFTLHAIWPFLWIWATLYRKDRGWGFLKNDHPEQSLTYLQDQITKLQSHMQSIESRIENLSAKYKTDEKDGNNSSLDDKGNNDKEKS